MIASGVSPPEVSVVIPTLDEAGAIGHLLDDLSTLAPPHEVIVADGGSGDGTPAVAAARGARVIEGPRGRGGQLRAGAAAARAPVLCFLHADVRLDTAALAALEQVVRTRAPGAHAFRLRIDGAGFGFRLIECGANARSAWCRLPYGDQGLVVSRAEYEAAGGYPAVPLMEDVALVRALGRITSVRLLPAAVRVSARRWERDGLIRRTLRNWGLLAAYLAGTSPERLAKRYRAAAEPDKRPNDPD
ncbi:MAG TPA: TIGR04283 family arsenosugar biosynthesis glycosyltransferase [Gemmatimonadales bacterium]|nr:TIGR04283 family arsenosugar biosynthesis glycosyltransferase [Gemmatimonadales bacterium]